MQARCKVDIECLRDDSLVYYAVMYYVGSELGRF